MIQWLNVVQIRETIPTTDDFTLFYITLTQRNIHPISTYSAELYKLLTVFSLIVYKQLGENPMRRYENILFAYVSRNLFV